MTLRTFLHDLVGYHGKRRELHAFLCVVEAHVHEHPEEWVLRHYERSDSRIGHPSRGKFHGIFNAEKDILILERNPSWSSGMFLGNKHGKYDDLDLSQAWYRRLERLANWHRDVYRGGLFYQETVGKLKDAISRFRKVTELEAFFEPDNGYVIAKVKAKKVLCG